jgi:prevent-host-death family protein
LTIVIDHSITFYVKEVAISEFKAKCLGLLEEVRKTRKPIRVTRFGEPVAEVVPSTAEKSKGRRLGSMAGSMKIVGDIVGPTGSLGDWDAWRE